MIQCQLCNLHWVYWGNQTPPYVTSFFTTYKFCKFVSCPNKPDEDWYWLVEISYTQAFSRCLISPCSSPFWLSFVSDVKWGLNSASSHESASVLGPSPILKCRVGLSYKATKLPKALPKYSTNRGVFWHATCLLKSIVSTWLNAVFGDYFQRLAVTFKRNEDILPCFTTKQILHDSCSILAVSSDLD